MLKAILTVLFAAFLMIGQAAAEDYEHETRRVDVEGASELDITIEFGAGELSISSDDIAEAAVVDLEYEPRYIVDYDVDYRVRGNTGHLEIESILRRESNIDTKRNECNIVLSTRYPTRLDLDVGACDAELDLGGIPLEELTIDIGAASGKVVFSTPNPVRMNEIDIDAGAASLDFNMIGNANFEQFSFDGGAGSFDLDFRGEYDGESTISIAIGLGLTDIILPEGIPIRIETGNAEWLSSVDIHNDDLEEVRDDIFESSDFDDAETRIILELDIGLGSADLFWKE